MAEVRILLHRPAQKLPVRYTSCTALLTHLAGLPLSAGKPHSISVPPGAHSKTSHTVIHFRPFLLKLLIDWTMSMGQEEGDSWEERSQQSLRIYARLLSVVAPDTTDNNGHGAMQGCRSLPLPSTRCPPSIHKTCDGKCTDLVPHRASKLW